MGETVQTSMVSSHGLHDVLNFTNLTTQDVNIAWGPEDYFDVVGLNGVRFWVFDSLQSGSVVLENVDQYNALKKDQVDKGTAVLKDVGGWSYADSKQMQTFKYEPGQVTAPEKRGKDAAPTSLFGNTGDSDAVYSPWCSKSSGKNTVGDHSKIFSKAGREVFVMRVPSGASDAICGFYYYGLQSVFDYEQITDKNSSCLFCALAELPPLKGGRQSYKKLPSNYELRSFELPEGKSLAMVNDTNSDIFVRTDEFENSWTLFVEGLPSWAMDAAGFATPEASNVIYSWLSGGCGAVLFGWAALF